MFACLGNIHHFMLRETGQLLHSGEQPGYFTTQSPLPQGGQQSCPPSSYECLMEKVVSLSHQLQSGGGSVSDNGGGEGGEGGMRLPYVGPRTFVQFIECFCEIYRVKNSEAVTEKQHLSQAVETLQRTQQDADTMKTTLSELRQKHGEASRLSEELLAHLTAKACQLERAKAILGHGSSVLSAIQVILYDMLL